MKLKNILFTALLASFVVLSGCETIKPYIPTLTKAAKVSLDYSQTASALVTIRRSYVSARDAITVNQAAFNEDEWATLRSGNQTAIHLHQRIQSLKQVNNEQLVISVSDLLNAIEPVRLSAAEVRTVIDAHIGDMPADAIQAYLAVRTDFDTINGRLESILARGDNTEKARMLLELFKTIARIAGVVVQIRGVAT